MESFSLNQLYIFTIFILTGILIAIIFDIFRILRKSFKTSDLITYIEDILFWIISGLILLYTIFKFNNGKIRIYIFIALLIGVTIYILLFSSTFIKINVIIINFIKKVVKQLFNVLIMPCRFIMKILRKILLKPITIICINIKKNTTNLNKKVLNNIKKITNKSKKDKIKEGF